VHCGAVGTRTVPSYCGRCGCWEIDDHDGVFNLDLEVLGDDFASLTDGTCP
jgi:hypothetical protein